MERGVPTKKRRLTSISLISSSSSSNDEENAGAIDNDTVRARRAMPSTSQSAQPSSSITLISADEQSPESSAESKSLRKVSDYFEYTTLEDEKVGKCRLCKGKNKIIKMKNSNTSGLRKHLSSMHKKAFTEMYPSYHQSSSGKPNQSTITIASLFKKVSSLFIIQSKKRIIKIIFTK